MRSIFDCILFGIFGFSAMLAGVLYPAESGRMLVVLKHGDVPATIYQIIDNTDGWLVEKVGPRTFVVESKATSFVGKLYENGAFLVLNGNARYGCGAPEISEGQPVGIENPYRHPSNSI